MHKKLLKYIDSYTLVQDKSYEILPRGGMTLVYNLGSSFELSYENSFKTLNNGEFVLVNVLENSLTLSSKEELNLVFIHFKGAGSAFFFSFSMDDLPLFIDVLQDSDVSFDIQSLDKNLDNFLLAQFQIPKSTFSILKILSLILEQKGIYDIDEVLLHADIPRKIFDKKFRAFVGLPLKTYAQIIKNSFKS